jgi:tRNA A37 threonylcarbamoyladenosine modification protein TsaB
LAQSLSVDLVGVSSLRALARGAGDQAPRVLAVIDARRSEVFVAAYDEGRESIAPQAISPDDLAELLEGAAIDIRAEQWLALGDGAILYRDAFERAGVRVAEDRCDYHRIQAYAICELGEQAVAGAQAILPDYRRRPDAEIAFEGAQA